MQSGAEYQPGTSCLRRREHQTRQMAHKSWRCVLAVDGRPSSRERERESSMSRWAEGAAASSPPFPHPSDMTPGCSERASWAMSQAGFGGKSPEREARRGGVVSSFGFFAVSFCFVLAASKIRSDQARAELELQVFSSHLRRRVGCCGFMRVGESQTLPL